MSPHSTRLNKWLALELGISRREADNLIAGGKVAINGSVAELGQQVTGHDKVTVNQKIVVRGAKFIYIALNKPVGYVCSRRQQGDTPTVYSLLPPEFQGLKLVGRLDKDSSGLLMLTNDGDFAHRMTHPKFAKSKIYEIEIDKPLSEEDFHKITGEGVDIGDMRPSKLELRVKSQESRKSRNTLNSGLLTLNSAYKVRLAEGRNRQIRRTFESLGYHVTRLHRTGFGNFSVAKIDLNLKEWQEIKLA